MNAVSHSVMFHHFHGLTHGKGQGSIDSDTFREMLLWLSVEFNLLSSDEYMDLALDNNLSDGDICLSFDDALLCQFDLALPVLDEFNIKAFFFIYSSPFLGDPDLLEIYRYFRNACFESIDEFYEDFFNMCKKNYVKDYSSIKLNYKKLNYLSEFEFYTYNDKWFRYLRDKILGKDVYKNLMLELMKNYGFNPELIKDNLWLTNAQLSQLSKEGHTLGLHSYSHPMQMKELSYEEQTLEFSKNFKHLSQIIDHESITSMSHPCGSYSEETLEILQEMGIQIGFRSNMAVNRVNSLLEIPREDHSNILKKMGLCE
ncbi:MAG: polysaccharide deacetylase family protein [Gammaproteobacteria bacterium]|nr:polysaccharide deacetylase family protein [Gammaproteobacteria bacterium]